MKAAFLTLLILGLQIRYDGATPVAHDDAIYPLLAQHQASIERKYKAGGYTFAEFSQWIHVESPAAAKLFPTLQFASVRWSERANPAAKKPVAQAIGLEKTLGVDRKKEKIVIELYGWGNYVAFGKLLVDHRIKLRDEEDAQLVWNAFCELHHKHWQHYKLQRISEREWRLGIFSYDQGISSFSGFRTIVTRTHCMKVTVDPESGRILSWKSIVDTSNKRKVPIPKRKGDPSI